MTKIKRLSLKKANIRRTCRIMRVFFLFFTLGISVCFSNNSYSQSTKISLNLNNKTVKQVFSEIEKNSEFIFFYQDDILDVNRKVTVNTDDGTIEQILNEVLSATGNTYFVSDRSIYIIKKASDNIVHEEDVVQQQKKTITGTITDKDGESIIGANIVEKGTTNGVVTDVNGNFSLQVEEGAILHVSYIGYLAQSIDTKGRVIFNIVLSEDLLSLDEVTVVGYGTQRKRDITGAVSSLAVSGIQDQPLPSIDAGMVGKIPGVQVSQPTGIPGGGITVRIRGVGSLGSGNEPLYVIDGFPVYAGYDQSSNPISGINPNDIAHMEILKDASATAIYGSRGANGVVIITTKSGQTGKPRINFDAYAGFNEVSKKLNLLNAQQYAEYIIDSRNNAWVSSAPGRNPSDPNNVRGNAIYQILPGLENPHILGQGTDWQDEIFRRGLIQNYQLSISGGTKNMNYFVSGSYHHSDGIILNSDFERYSFRVNLETDISDRLKFGVNASPSYTFNNIVDSEGHFGNGAVVLSALLMPPHLSVYEANGEHVKGGNFGYGLSGIQNPVMTALEEKNQRGQFRFLGTTFMELEIVKRLIFKTSVGVDFNTARRNAFVPSSVDIGGTANGSSGTSQAINWLNENTLSYSNNFERHHLSSVIGYTVQKEQFESNYVSATNYPNDLVPTLNAGTINGGSSGISEWALISYLGRVNYAFDNKYLLSVALRTDGSSRFGNNNKWGTFPSVSAGWVMSDEQFLKDVQWLHNLKIRTSYGVTGNNSIGNYEHIALLSDRNYVFGSGGGALVNGLYPNRVPNPNLGWETNTQFNVGLDFSIFQNRLSFIVDFYDKLTSNMLLQVPVPTITGYSSARQNIGKLKNRGWELGVSSRNLVDAFRWDTEFNISANRNEVLALGPTNAPIFSSYDIQNIFVTEVGKPLGNYYGYKVIGVYLDEEDLNSSPRFADSRPGHLKFEDTDGNGSLDTNDRTILGNPFPDFIWGLSNDFSYKGFDLSIAIQGVVGGERLHLGRRFYGNYAGTANALVDVLNRWKSPDDPGDGFTPMVNRDLGRYSSSNSSANVSSKFVEDASYIRIRNISLGYELPQNLVKDLFVQKIRLYANVQNVSTFTKYTGFNPEVSLVGHSTLTPGIDYGTYPLPRTYTFGVNLIF